MPTVFRIAGVRFSFYSNEGDPREPIHVHAFGAGAQAKLWLYPEVRIEYSAASPRVSRYSSSVRWKRGAS